MDGMSVAQCDGMSQPSSLHPLTNVWNHILADSST